MLDIIALTLRHRRVLLALLAAGAIVAIVWTLLLPRTYTTTLSFTPAGPAQPAGGLATLAGQLGIDVGADRSGSPEFYAALLQTREILQPLVERRYRVTRDGDTTSASFIALYDVSGRDSGRTVAEAISVLKNEVLTINVDRRTSIVSVGVTTRWRDLSLQLSQALLAAVDEFNIRSRHQQRGAERQFFEERLDTARTELRVAQDRLEQFYARNRSFERDPRLQFEHDRLRTDATLRAEVFGTITQAYEQARIAAVRSTPSVSLVEEPQLALKPDRRNLIGRAVVGLVAGLVLGITLLAWMDISARARTQRPGDYAEVQRLWGMTKDEARALFLRRKG